MQDSCRLYIKAKIVNSRVNLKPLAAAMNLSASHLARKIVQNPGDSARFTLDDLENFIQVTEDVTPIHYLVEKHITKNKSRIQALKEELARLESLEG